MPSVDYRVLSIAYFLLFLQPTKSSNDAYSDRLLFSTHKEEADTLVFETDLNDVLFCLFMALGWTVWMLSSFIRNDLAKFQDSTLVEGNVLHVTPLASYDPEPQYRCLIDYAVIQADTHKTITIRKYFITKERLENGFANVEVLVLPEDPHQSTLRSDWEAECRDVQLDHFCWETKAFKRLSIGFGLILVLASIAGSVLAVEHMPEEIKAFGWLSVCLGSTLLLPTAVIIHRVLMLIQKSLEAPAQGTVVGQQDDGHAFIDCDRLDVLDARACDDEVASLDAKKKFKYSAARRGFGCYFIEMPVATGRTRSGGSSSSLSTVSSISIDRHPNNRSNSNNL